MENFTKEEEMEREASQFFAKYFLDNWIGISVNEDEVDRFLAYLDQFEEDVKKRESH